MNVFKINQVENQELQDDNQEEIQEKLVYGSTTISNNRLIGKIE